MNLEEALDRLYAAPLEEFTSTRNALAAELGPEGAPVKSLKKPNLAAWALNQLSRLHPAELGELFEVTDGLRKAQRRVMSGAKAGELRTATDARNAVVAKLTNLAAAVLEGAGHGVAASTLAAISDSFVAVASDQNGGAGLRAGRLERPLEPSSVVDVGGLTLVEPLSGEDAGLAGETTSGELRLAASQVRVRLKEAKDAARSAQAEAERLAREADEAEGVAKAKREEAEFAHRAAEARQGEVAEAEEALREAEDALNDRS